MREQMQAPSELARNGLRVSIRALPRCVPDMGHDYLASQIVSFQEAAQGIGTHLIVVPYETLKFAEEKIILPGGTEETLKILPEFKYATE